MRIDLARAVDWMGGSGDVQGVATGWSTDTRTLVAGDVYFALRGPAFDGHAFVADAFAKGAVAAVVDAAVDASGTLVRVPDVLAALQTLALHARRSWNGTVIGVTGSAGKTTTKDVIAHFAATQFPTGKTHGNLNNHIGLPLSLLRMPDEARVAVLEMGMNHAGEIHDLCAIAEPRIGVVTNVGYAHVEFFDSIDGIALAKRELIESLPPWGIAVLNADDARVAAFANVHAGRSITYGFHEHADVRATDVELGPRGSRFTVDGVAFAVPLAGRHGVSNVLAGIAAARALGIPVSQLAEAARTIPIGKMRGEVTLHGGLILVNDAYNANPEAMRSMLDMLAAMPARRHVAVLGEMLELGAQSEALHRSIGEHAAAAHIDLLVGIRGNSRAMLESAASAGVDTRYFNDAPSAGDALRDLLVPGDAVLFKGSRGVHVELALEKLLEARG